MHDVHVQSVALSLMWPPSLIRCSSKSEPRLSQVSVRRISACTQSLVTICTTATYLPESLLHTHLSSCVPQNSGKLKLYAPPVVGITPPMLWPSALSR